MIRIFIIIICFFLTWTANAQIDNNVVPNDDIENGYYSLEQCKVLLESQRGDEVIESLIYHKQRELVNHNIDTLKYLAITIGLIRSYSQVGNIESAQNEIEELNQKVGLDNLPPDYAWQINQLAGIIAYQLKDYSNALKNYYCAFKKVDKSNLETINYATALANIGLCYKELANTDDHRFYITAKWYIDESLSVFEEKYGPLMENGAIGLTLLSNKAVLYEAIGDSKGAMETLEQIVSSFSGKEDVEQSWILAVNNLSVLYLKTGQYDKCIGLLEQVNCKNKEIAEIIKSNLVLAYFMSDNSKLRASLEGYNQTCYDNCLEIFKNFTEAERENYWTLQAGTLLLLNNLVAEKYPQMTDVVYDNLLFVKNLKLMSSDVLRKIVDGSTNHLVKEEYNKICDLRDAISYRSNSKDSIASWTSLLKEKERRLLNLVPDYKERLRSSFHKWGEIKNALKKDEIAIEFTYSYEINTREISETYYAAMIVTNTSEIPLFVKLCDNDELNTYFTEATADMLQISSLYNDSTSVYEKIWNKLEPYIKGKRTVYFSPIGQLNLLNHSAIELPDGSKLGDKYNLVRLSSTDKILGLTNKKSMENKGRSAILYGGIVYDLSIAHMTEVAKKYRHSGEDNYLALRSEDERGRWNYLPNTKIEAQNIYDLLLHNGIQTYLLQGGEANEESFKSFSGKSPNIIHLSTHGFFLNSKEKERVNPFMSTIGNYSKKEDQLIRTGLLMAGANNVWCGKEQVSGIEDGILTADEISRLDLSNTDLVVLSACETAKGKVDEVDGVLGLQRGFKKAGVNTIVMSLWKVPDQATSILMTSFYEHLLQGKDARTSLKEAQQYLMNQNDGYRNPYYWAAFVVLD